MLTPECWSSPPENLPLVWNGSVHVHITDIPPNMVILKREMEDKSSSLSSAWIGLPYIHITASTRVLFYPGLLLACIVYYVFTDLWCKIYIQNLYFPDTLVILPTLWHRLDSKFVTTYAYFCPVNLRRKDKRPVYEAVLENINNCSLVYIIGIHTWSTRQVRKLAEVLF